MRRLSLVVVLLLVASTSAFAGDRHLIFTPAEPMSESLVASLAARGMTVQKVLTGGRYLVVADTTDRAPRIASDTELQSVGSFEPMRPEAKIDRSVARELARGRAAARLRVMFHEDVTLDDAREAITAAGGSLRDPLQVTFGVMQSLSVAVPRAGIDALAVDDRVMAVAASERFPVRSDDAIALGTTKASVVQAAPYGLSGRGVTLSMFELRQPDAAHQEFGGRLTAHDGNSAGSADGKAGDELHATHVAGVIAAAGVQAPARGAATEAALHSFIIDVDDKWIDEKAKLVSSYGSVVDNNSWGYVLGWKGPKYSSPDVIWNEYGEYYGAYSLWDSAPLDRMTRESGILFVHSAGNDGSGAALDEWSRHKHRTTGDKVWCYSKNGKGDDCPTLQCNGGANTCETEPHSPNVPFGVLGVTASAKNVVAVGNIYKQADVKTIYGSSARGPARDGRVKPDVVAPGVFILSSTPGNGYAELTGTSMAAPMVTGTAGLLVEQWRRSFAGANPTPAELKALLIAGAEDLGNSGPDYTYGFGLIDAKASADLIIADAGSRRYIRRAAVATGGTYEMPIVVPAGGAKVRVVLQWLDPEIVPLSNDEEIAAKALVNDLDVVVIAPDGTETRPYKLDLADFKAPAKQGVNTVDNTELVEIGGPVAGVYRIVVTGTNVVGKWSPQEFVIVTNAPAPPPCSDLQERGNDADSAYGIVKGQSVNGALCSEADVDYFRFIVYDNGPVSVALKTGDTPVKATLLWGTTELASTTVAANTTGTVTANFQSPLLSAPPPPATLVLKIERAGALGVLPSYTLTPTVPIHAPVKRRSTGR